MLILTRTLKISLVFIFFSLLGIAHADTFKNLGQDIDDSIITTKIKAKFAESKSINALKISVTTKQGMVYLKGHVDTQAAFNNAIVLAKDTKGVKGVNTVALKVDKVNSPLKDAYISAKIDALLFKNSLFHNKDIPVIGVNVRVKNGHVYLSGKVKHKKQIAPIVDTVKKVEGVKGVTNNIQVEE